MGDNSTDTAKSNRPAVELLGKIVNEAIAIASAKGWQAEIDSLDKETGRFASIYVERTFAYDRTITGSFEISMLDGGLKMKTEKTSFYSNGLQDLQDSIWRGFEALGWFAKDKQAGPKISTETELIDRVLRRFHRSARQLKNRHADRPALRLEDEYDVQDYLHALLRSLYDDIRAEEYCPSYAGGASRIDFLLKSEGIAIEVKMASAKIRDRQIGEQLIIDIQRYQSHPSVKQLYCFVYDPEGEVRNTAGLEADLSKSYHKLVVKVIIVSPS